MPPTKVVGNLANVEARYDEIHRLYFEDHWTQTEIAQEMNCSQALVSKVLRKKRLSYPEPNVTQEMLERFYEVSEDVRIARQRWHRGERGAGRDYVRLLDYQARNFFPSIQVVMGANGPGMQTIEFLENGRPLPDDDPRVIALLHRQADKAPLALTVER